MAWIRFSGVRGKGLAALRDCCRSSCCIAFWQSARGDLRAPAGRRAGMGGYVSFPGRDDGVLPQSPARRARAELGRRASRTGCSRSSPTAFSPAFPARSARPPRSSGPATRCAGTSPRCPRPKTRYQGRAGALEAARVGGSQGAQALNEVVPRALALLPAPSRPAVTHQAGAARQAAVRRALSQPRRGGGRGRVHRRHGARATRRPT